MGRVRDGPRSGPVASPERIGTVEIPHEVQSAAHGGELSKTSVLGRLRADVVPDQHGPFGRPVAPPELVAHPGRERGKVGVEEEDTVDVGEVADADGLDHYGAGGAPVGPPQAGIGPVGRAEEDEPAGFHEWPRQRAGGGVERVIDVLDEESPRIWRSLLARTDPSRRDEPQDEGGKNSPNPGRGPHRWFSFHRRWERFELPQNVGPPPEAEQWGGPETGVRETLKDFALLGGSALKTTPQGPPGPQATWSRCRLPPTLRTDESRPCSSSWASPRSSSRGRATAGRAGGTRRSSTER